MADPTRDEDLTCAVIGAGPTGLAALRTLQRYGVPAVGYELADDVGGLWHIDGPRSTMYESAHLISSKTTTAYAEFPMREEVAEEAAAEEAEVESLEEAHRFMVRDYQAKRERKRKAEAQAGKGGGGAATPRLVDRSDAATIP